MLEAFLANPGSLVIAGWLLLAIGSLSVLIVTFLSNTETRPRSGFLLIGALAYAALNIGVFFVTIQLDQFAIFSLFYVIPVAGMPALILPFLRLLPMASASSDRAGVFALAIWIACVSIAHFVVIVAASAGV